MSKDYIVTAWVPVVVRVERVSDEDMAVGVAHDYLTQLDPLTGENTLMQRLAEAVEPTVWFPGDQWDWPEMEAVVAEDSEDYGDDPDDGFEPTEAQLASLYGDHGDSPSYRRDMQDAGRGHLLR